MKDDRDKCEDVSEYDVANSELYEIVYDKEGNRVMRVKEQAPVKSVSKSGWEDYDTSMGHCGLCGRLTCAGNCFK